MGGHDRFDIAGKVAIVTGAASGIGLAIAEAMAEGGAKVALLDLDQGGLEQARDRLRKIGSDAVLEKVDVSNRTEMRRAIDSVADHFGGLDITFAMPASAANRGSRASTGRSIPPD